MQKTFNNLYVKNFPQEWEDKELREMFEKFGPILSCAIFKNETTGLKYGFVCYGTEEVDGDEK